MNLKLEGVKTTEFLLVINMKIRSILALATAALLSFSMVGCGKDNGPSWITADGKIPSWTMEEAPDGYYIYKAENHRVYQGLMMGYMDDNHYWLIEDYEKAIPKLTPEDQIIVKNISNRPNSFRFIKFADLGYTIGTNFSVIQNSGDLKSPTIITFGADQNPASPIGSYIGTEIGEIDTANVKILAINDQEFKPSMLTEGGYMHNLTKNGMYKFTYFKGTYQKDIRLKADSRLFVAVTTYNTTGYSEMGDGNYFIINPPASIEAGYYYLEGYGLFEYTGNVGLPGQSVDKVIDDGSEEKPAPKTDETVEE